MLAPQHGQSLVQCMVGMMLSLLVVMAAFSAFAWIQRSQALLQQQMDMHQMLHQATAKLRERAMRAGASELWIEEPHKLVWNSLPNKVVNKQILCHQAHKNHFDNLNLYYNIRQIL